MINTTFVAANPRNNLRLEDTYTAVELLVDGQWARALDDSDWELFFTWIRDDGLLGTSHVVVSWDTSVDVDNVQRGTYRMGYFGDAKGLLGNIESFEGWSGNFTLV